MLDKGDKDVEGRISQNLWKTPHSTKGQPCF